MSERIPQRPPEIAPVTLPHRPLWSVMIPAYNCMNYLGCTLESVLAQDPGPALMQIEVVDDCSTDGDVAALVKEIGKGRVEYYRQEQNKGSLRNFETCLNRSTGKWIHILHGDDMVKQGFYQEVTDLFTNNPEAGAAITHYDYIDTQGTVVMIPEKIREKSGILEAWLEKICQNNLVQPPAVVVKRAVYEELGGFFAVHYGEDWEMWVRIAAHYPVVYSPRLLASYRLHENNITTRYFSTGQTVDDIRKVIDIMQGYFPEDKRKEVKRRASRNFSIYFARSSHHLYHNQKNPKGALKVATKALKMDQNMSTIFWTFRLFTKYWLHYKR
jgi:glycosyltransferase involved in cell wall biosynthesis